MGLRGLLPSACLLVAAGCAHSGFDDVTDRSESYTDVLVQRVGAVMPERELSCASPSRAFARCKATDLQSLLDAFECAQEVRSAACATETGQDPPDCEPELLLGDCRARLDGISQNCADGFNDAVAPPLAAAEGDTFISPTPEECREALFAAQLAKLAYRPDGVESGLRAMDPRFSQVRAYKGASPDGGDEGFAFTAALGSECYVAFRGTRIPDDILRDLQSLSLKVFVNAVGEVFEQRHCAQGFYERYRAFRNAGLTRDLAHQLQDGTCSTLSIYGHSLGGALASLLAADLTSLLDFDGKVIRSVTFGEPRTWSAEDGDVIEALVSKRRWVAWGDPIPSVLPAAFGLEHFGDAVEIYKTWTGRVTFRQRERGFTPPGLWSANHRLDQYIERIGAGCSGS